MLAYNNRQCQDALETPTWDGLAEEAPFQRSGPISFSLVSNTVEGAPGRLVPKDRLVNKNTQSSVVPAGSDGKYLERRTAFRQDE